MAGDRLKLKLILPYSGIPVIVAALLVMLWGRLDMFVLLWCVLIVVFGYVAAFLDFKTKKIPNTLILAMFAAWVTTVMPKLFLDTDATLDLLIDSSLGLAIGGGLFLLVYIISRKGVGGGDVKFMAATGLYLGFSGTLSAMLYGTVLAGLVGIVLLVIKKIGRKDPMPFAPFIYIGILITVFYSASL